MGSADPIRRRRARANPAVKFFTIRISHSIFWRLTMFESNGHISIAISKGRIIQDVLPMLAASGITPKDDPLTTRKLVIDTENPAISLIIVRSYDVPAYVALGGADLGIVGKDVLLEHQDSKIYELADLRIAQCRIVVAERADDALKDARELNGRVATKYVHTARRHFAARGEAVNVMKLNGSVELAPLCGIASRIVDLTETGTTLRTNGLREVETIAFSSARLVACKASMRLKEHPMKQIASRIEQAAAEHAA